MSLIIAGKGESRTVESVAELNLLVLGMAIAALEAIGLIGVEVADRRYLQPAPLSLGIYLEVIADGRCERLVATAEEQYAIGQF